MQPRERNTLISQMVTGASYESATVWRCVLGLALVIVVTMQGTYETPARDAALTAAETKQSAALDEARAAANRKDLLDDARCAAHRKDLLDDARCAAHRKELFDARRLRFQRVAADVAGRQSA